MKIVSLFSGAGGLDYGLLQSGHSIVWANDIDPDAVKTYSQNIGNHIICADISDVNINKIPYSDVVIGGFPCQGFSIANLKRDIFDERNILYKFFKRIVENKKPKLFIAENVKGILSLGKGIVIRNIVDDFQKAGYLIQINKVNAADYGVPQHRERIFIIGQRIDISNDILFHFPRPTHSGKGDGLPWVTMKDALDSIPLSYNPNSDPNSIGSTYHCIPRNFTAHRISDPDKPSPTILARGNGKGGVCAIPHYNGKRRLTIRESAIIQTFPLSFVFYGKMGSCYRQIGNAVPVLLAKKIGEELTNAENYL